MRGRGIMKGLLPVSLSLIIMSCIVQGAEEAPGAFTSQGELPQLDFARMGAFKQSSPTMCLKTKHACLLLCARRGVLDPASSSNGDSHHQHSNIHQLHEGPSSSNLHMISPYVGCVCLGAPGDALAQVAILRREAQRYHAVFGHDCSARVLAHRLGDILQGKGQQAWTRPPACISILASWEHGRQGPEFLQVDPTGLVVSLKAAGIGGADAGDKAMKWLEEVVDEDTGRLKELEGEEEEEEKEERGKALEKAWEGMKESWPGLEGHSNQIDVGMASGKGFRKLGTLNKLLLKHQHHHHHHKS